MTPCELWLGACVPHQRTTSHHRRHPTCSASSQWSHTVSSTPCHEAWTPSTQRSSVHQVQVHGASNRNTHLYPPHNNSSVHLTTTTYVGRARRITNGVGSGRIPYKTPHFHLRHRYPPPRNDPPKKSLGPTKPSPHRCWTFPLLFVQMGMAFSAACECGAEEQTVDQVVLQCLFH